MIALLKFWREALIVLLCAGLWFFYSDDKFNKQQVADLKPKLEACSAEKAIVDKAVEDSKVALEEANKKRVVIITKTAKAVDVIRQQEAPKECEKAITFAVEHKDDLSWPK